VDLKRLQSLTYQTFSTRPKSEFGEHLATQASKSTGSVNDFWQQVANFVFNIRNLLFSQVSLLQTDTDKQWQR